MLQGPRRVWNASYECTYLGTLGALLIGEGVAMAVNSALGTSIDRNVVYPVAAAGLYTLYKGADKFRNRNRAPMVVQAAIAPANPPHQPALVLANQRQGAGDARIDQGNGADHGVEQRRRVRGRSPARRGGRND